MQYVPFHIHTSITNPKHNPNPNQKSKWYEDWQRLLAKMSSELQLLKGYVRKMHI